MFSEEICHQIDNEAIIDYLTFGHTLNWKSFFKAKKFNAKLSFEYVDIKSKVRIAYRILKFMRGIF